jgi:flavin-dependent dehydrogenase
MGVFPSATTCRSACSRRGAARANLPEYYRRYLDVLGIGTPLHEERHGYIIPCRPRAGLFDAPRVLFVGDAAGLADPVTAEGITAGILSGQFAARAILEGDFAEPAVKRAYRAALRQTLLPSCAPRAGWPAACIVVRGCAPDCCRDTADG